MVRLQIKILSAQPISLGFFSHPVKDKLTKRPLTCMKLMAVVTAFSFLLSRGHGRVSSRGCPISSQSCAPRPFLTTMSIAHQRMELPARVAKIVCIGDIHGQWDRDDETALRGLNPDLALFVGDYGDEDVVVTRRIADLAASSTFGVAIVFGNHDAFYTASHSGRKRAPYDKNQICRVTEQLEMLAPYDVSYKSFAFDDIRLSVCGGRAFSVGGPNWKYRQFFQRFVGVGSLQHSTRLIKEAVLKSQYNTLIFLSHSGPTGLGAKPNDPCGKDWGEEPGGDYGDEDLRGAIEEARKEGIKVPLTVFGHMHKTLLKNRGARTMVKSEADGNSGSETVMVNAAVVPRHKIGHASNATLHHFQVVQMSDGGNVDSVEETWVTSQGDIVESIPLFKAQSPTLVDPVSIANTAT